MTIKIEFIAGNSHNEVHLGDSRPLDVFHVIEEGKAPVAVALYHAYGDNPNDAIEIDNSEACTLSGINGSLHLSACVAMTIMKGFADEHSFYFEQFFDEDGNTIEKELIILPM